MDAPNAIAMKNNLPVVNYATNNATDTQPRDAVQRCPTGAIVWIERDGKVILGKESKSIVRQTPLQPLPS
jgi:hypothetical protein